MILACAAVGCGHVAHETVKEPREAPRLSSANKGAPEPSLAPEAAPARTKILEKDRQGCTWVESEATVTAGEQDSRHQTRAAAISEARKFAMQDFLGVEVRSRLLDFQYERLRDQQKLTENILQTTRLGRIMKETLVTEGYEDLPRCRFCRYHVQLKSCLVPIAADADKGFFAELALSRSHFMQGDEARLTVTANRDFYVYLYDVDMDWQTTLIFPNDIVPQAKITAGAVWEYPDEAARKEGVRLTALIPDGKNVSAETIRVIVSKSPLPKKLIDPTGVGYLGVMQRLNSSRWEWTEDASAFVIYRY